MFNINPTLTRKEWKERLQEVVDAEPKGFYPQAHFTSSDWFKPIERELSEIVFGVCEYIRQVTPSKDQLSTHPHHVDNLKNVYTVTMEMIGEGNNLCRYLDSVKVMHIYGSAGGWLRTIDKYTTFRDAWMLFWAETLHDFLELCSDYERNWIFSENYNIVGKLAGFNIKSNINWEEKK